MGDNYKIDNFRQKNKEKKNYNSCCNLYMKQNKKYL